MKENNYHRDQLNSFVQQCSSAVEFEASPEQWSDWKDYIYHQPGVNPLLLPDWAGERLIMDPEVSRLFREMTLLSETEKLILFFTARGHDPKLIVESIPGISINEYWKRLEEAQTVLNRKLGPVPEHDLQVLENELNNIVENWIEFSEKWDKQADRRHTKRRTSFLILFSFLVLISLYMFVWPLLFPYDGQSFFEQHQQEFLQAIRELPQSDLSQELLLLAENQDFEASLTLLEEELILQDQVQTTCIAYYIALLIRTRDFKEARHLIRENQNSFNTDLQDIFKNVIWKIRFHP